MTGDPATLGSVQLDDENSVVRPGRVALVAIAIAVVVVLLAVALPAELRFLAVLVALIAGIGLERFRQSHFPPPPTLRETPQAWRNVLRYEVGYRQFAVALVLLAGAAAVLVVSIDTGTDESTTGDVSAPPVAGEQPDLRVQREAVDEPFVRDGIEFDVTARREHRSPLYRGIGSPDDDLLAVDIAMTNEARNRFNPATLDYRLRAAGHMLLGPARSTAIGSDALVRQGSVPIGGDVTQKLIFAVPQKSGDLALEFEPVSAGPVRVRVPLELD